MADDCVQVDVEEVGCKDAALGSAAVGVQVRAVESLLSCDYLLSLPVIFDQSAEPFSYSVLSHLLQCALPVELVVGLLKIKEDLEKG